MTYLGPAARLHKMPSCAQKFLLLVASSLLAYLAEAASCGAAIPRSQLLDTVAALIPMSDGSRLALADPAASRLLDVLDGNLHAMGLTLQCAGEQCNVQGATDAACARAFVAAVLGNFLNNDLEPDDALARVRVDVATGLLQRHFPENHYRIMFVDFLLVLAVILLAKRAVDDQGK